MSLKLYRKKRDFSQTPEPEGKLRQKSQGTQKALRFVIQMHRATRLHFDFRLEWGGTFKSWAVPKGPSLNPQDQRLAVFVEDHPLEYGSFEGIIPKGNYGAGTVMLWDEGTYLERSSDDRKQSEAAMKNGLKKGHLTFVLEGKKLKGEFALIQLKKGEGDKAWLLVKKRDAYSTFKRDQDLDMHSVKTGRTLDEIEEQAVAEGNIWFSKRSQKAERVEKYAKGSSIAKAKIASKTESQPKKIRHKDPMPRQIKPMLATVSRQPIEGDTWIYEEKNEGLRALAEVEGKSVKLYSKSGLSFNAKFPEIVAELISLGIHAAFDGEVIQKNGSTLYSVFDLLYYDGKDLRQEPLRDRRKILSQLTLSGKSIGLAPTTDSPGKAKGSWIAKNLESVYKSGTTKDWLLVQNLTERKASIQDEPRLTHLDRIYWPGEGITKGDLLEYYRAIAPTILPYLKDRPESLNRLPHGISAAGFYQKDMIGHIPRWLKTERVFSESADKSINYVLCQDERSLLYIVNLGCIELHPWLSRVGHLDRPDFIVIDLDPDGNDFDHVIEIAHEFHQVLDEIGAHNFCKTSGATGIHIGIPVGARYDYDTVRVFAEDVCKVIAKRFPTTTSLERSPARRKGKVYLDFLQNRKGQTLAAPYCVRPKPGAPVSMPVSWKDLKPGLRPEEFHIKNAVRLIQKKKDLWKGVLGSAVSLEKCQLMLKNRFKL